MRKEIFLLMAFLVFYIMPSSAQDQASDVRFTIKTNPLAALGSPLYVAFVPITGEYKVLFEVKTTPKQSIEFGAGYLGSSVILNLDELSDSINKIDVSGFRVQLRYKFFITKDEAPEGFYIGPHVSFAKATVSNRDNQDDNFSLAKLNVNVLFGYQLITNGGFTLDLFTGLGVKLRDYDIPDESDFILDELGNKVAPNVAVGFSFGYAF